MRREGRGLRRYVHIGTGNYNPKTALVYEDLGLFTTDPAIGTDLSQLFNYLTGFGRAVDYEKLIIAPDHLRGGHARNHPPPDQHRVQPEEQPREPDAPDGEVITASGDVEICTPSARSAPFSRCPPRN